jgi:hypothetical protein
MSAITLTLVLLVQSAQAPPPAHTLVSARSVFVVSELGDRWEVEPVLEELRSWRRLTVSPDRDAADLVLVVGATNQAAVMGLPASSTNPNVPPIEFLMQAKDRASGAELWMTTARQGWSYKRTLKGMVKKLRERVEKDERQSRGR